MMTAHNATWRHLRTGVTCLAGKRPPYFALRIPTHFTLEEKIALYRTALKLPFSCVALEIGSYLGASTCIIGSAVQGRQGVLHCVDTWQNQAMDEPERDTWAEFEANTRRLARVIIPHRGYSVEVARTLSINLDFLLVDGDHSEEAVDADLSAWSGKVKPGGVVAFHDVGWAEGVQAGIRRHLSGRVEWIEKLSNLWIGRLGRGLPSASQPRDTQRSATSSFPGGEGDAP